MSNNSPAMEPFLASDLTSIILWSANADGTVDYINEIWSMGPKNSSESKTVEECNPFNKIHPEDKDRIMKLWKSSIRTETSLNTECRILKDADKAYCWYSLKANFIREDKNKSKRWLGSFTDIHSQKLQQASLEQENLHLTTLNSINTESLQRKDQALNLMLSYIPGLFYKINQRGIITEIAGGRLKNFGYDSPDLVGKHSSLIFEKKLLKSLFKFGRTSTNASYSGKDFYYEHLTFPDNLSNGGIVGFAIDVTERKRNNDALEEEMEKFQAIFNQAHHVILLLDPQGYILDINKKALDLRQLLKQEILGKPFWEMNWCITSQETHEKLVNSVQEASRGIFVRHELQGLNKNGIMVTVDFSMKPVYDNNNAIKYILAEGRDITEKKKAEEELREAKNAAENASTFKTKFLANMSHDIRTPLNAIIGFANVLRKNQNISGEKRDEYLGLINSSGNILLKLIDDILDLSKVEEGKLTIQNEKFNLKQNIKSCLEPYIYKAKEKNVRLNLFMDEFLPDYIYGDPYRLKQILINLVSNSIKFTHSGEIRIEIEDLTNRESTDKECLLKLSISDSGIGVPLQKQREIFDSFTQGNDSISQEYGGSGLGLSITKQLVSLMGGEIGVVSPIKKDSTTNPGSLFWVKIKFPVDSTKGIIKTDHETSTKLEFKEPVNVLVVEDNMVNRQLASVILKNIGCKTDFAVNGEEAIEIVKKKEFDIILMDVQMPVINGYDATKIIRTEHNQKIPIVGVTANVFQEAVEACINSGMNDHIAKPYNEKDLFEIIKKWTVPANKNEIY